jgi:tol-pal system protein YbgF
MRTRVRDTRRGGSGLSPRAAAGVTSVLSLACVACLASCTPPQLLTLRSALDSLRTVVDSMDVRQSATLAEVRSARREIAEQRDILLSTRASTGTTTQELFEQMGRLEGKLDEVMGRFSQITQRAPATGGSPAAGGSPSAGPGPTGPGGAGGSDSNQMYDQAAQDLTQGRYDLALQGFREFVSRYPKAELADNAQYGVGESFFARSQFDSAAAEYARVEVQYPQGDKVPAALYKLALSQEKLGRPTDSRATLERLVRRFPLSGEAQLAKERLGGPRRR